MRRKSEKSFETYKINNLKKKKIKKKPKNSNFIKKKKISKYNQSTEKFSTDRLGPRFTDLLSDELSIFEEGRAVREIFKHEEELEKEQERKEEEERRAELLRQKQKRDKG